jgi:tetratricopeptide (TPR) repeat protein
MKILAICAAAVVLLAAAARAAEPAGAPAKPAVRTAGWQSPVRAWEEPTVIPTYELGRPEQNPVFFRHRNVQGAAGNVYPLTMQDQLTGRRVDKTYRGLYLENEYVKLMVLPELGGRIHTLVDKTNGYDAIYHQHVIKPALIGTLGAWISGGIEWNFPQHHRPTTFMPQDSVITENADGSKTIWVGEVEPLNRIKGMVGITLRPGSSLVELRGRVFNRTPLPQTFLWWVNMAVHAGEQYQSFFAEDVSTMVFHNKTQAVAFPIARSFYSGVDYSRGVDISWYKNIPLPTSYFARASNYDFFGGYDHGKRAGIVHVADHHLSPGKKLWTWGTGVFGQVWEKNLTKSDGPYAELMAGVYSDNQPDFSWLAPYEVKTFTQYIYPIREIGTCNMANKEAALHVEAREGTVHVGVHVTSVQRGARVFATVGGRNAWQKTADLAPDQPLSGTFSLPPGTRREDLGVVITGAEHRELLRYRAYTGKPEPLPPPHRPDPEPPEKLATNELLYLTGLHLEQFRHPKIDPDPYYQEALRRDPGDLRVNNAYGRLLLRRGQFAEAEAHFRRAIQTATTKNAHPYDGEPYYNLGLALEYQGKFDAAYDAHYKATWSQACKAQAYLALAAIDGRRREFDKALEHLDLSLAHNGLNHTAMAMKSAVLRQLGRPEEATRVAWQSVEQDPLDFWCFWDLCRIWSGSAARWARPSLEQLAWLKSNEQATSRLHRLMRDNSQTYLDVAIGYDRLGLPREALGILGELHAPDCPLVAYYRAHLLAEMGDTDAAARGYRTAPLVSAAGGFPSRLEDFAVLREALAINPADAHAWYYLGNLLYDKRRPEEAIRAWEKSRELDGSFATVHRNLAQAYCEVLHEPGRALVSCKRAFELDPNDPRILMELDQLNRECGVDAAARLALLENHPAVTEQREELYLSCAELRLRLGKYEEARRLLEGHVFHAWEGGEGAVRQIYELACLLEGFSRLKAGRPAEALASAEAALKTPDNLRDAQNPENPAYHAARLECCVGVVRDAAGQGPRARECFLRAAAQRDEKTEYAFYRGLALAKLGRQQEADRLFADLVAEGRERAKAAEPITAAAGNFLLGLGDLGQGHAAAAAAALPKARQPDRSDLAPRIELACCAAAVATSARGSGLPRK